MRGGAAWIVAAVLTGIVLGLGAANTLPERTTVPAARQFFCAADDAAWANPQDNVLPTITCVGGRDSGDNVTTYATGVVLGVFVAVMVLLASVVLRLTGPRRGDAGRIRMPY